MELVIKFLLIVLVGGILFPLEEKLGVGQAAQIISIFCVLFVIWVWPTEQKKDEENN